MNGCVDDRVEQERRWLHWSSGGGTSVVFEPLPDSALALFRQNAVRYLFVDLVRNA